MQLNQHATDIIIDALNQYSNTELSVDDFLYQLLDESKAYSSDAEIKDSITKISDTLTAISEAYQDIQRYKAKGASTKEWLQHQLEQTIQHLPQDQQNDIIIAIKTALNDGNQQLFQQLGNLENPVDLVASLVSNQFEDINKTLCVDNLQQEIQLNALLNALTLDKIQTDDTIPNDCKAAIDYFVAPLDDETDTNFKKVVVASVEIAKKKNLLPDSVANASTEQITAIIDNGVTSAKVAYKVANAELDPIEAIEHLIDKTAARVKTVMTETCKNAGGNIGASIGSALGGLINPAAAVLGAKVGRVVGNVAGQKIAEVVNKGVNMVASAAKSVTRIVCESVKSAGRAVLGWLGF